MRFPTETEKSPVNGAVVIMENKVNTFRAQYILGHVGRQVFHLFEPLWQSKSRSHIKGPDTLP